MRVAVFVCVAAVVLAADQLTKWLAVAHLSGGRRVPVFGQLLSLRLLYNPGASLGMGSGMTWVISLVAAAACVALCVLAAVTRSMSWSVAFALAFGGAAGNLIDRVANATGFLDGKVIDFLDYGWSVGNVADIALVAAAAMIAVLIMRGTPFGAPRPEDGPGADDADDIRNGSGRDSAR